MSEGKVFSFDELAQVFKLGGGKNCANFHCQHCPFYSKFANNKVSRTCTMQLNILSRDWANDYIKTKQLIEANLKLIESL